MEKIREKIMAILAKDHFRSEDHFKVEALEIFLHELKVIQADSWKLRGFMANFASLLMACLVVLKSRQPLENIPMIERGFQSKNKEIEADFLKRVIAPLCQQANKIAIEIAVIFLYGDSEEVIGCAQKILKELGGTKESMGEVSKVLCEHATKNVSALTVFCKIDAKAATEEAFKLLTSKDERFRQAALRVFEKAPLDREIAVKVASFLMDAKSKVLWKDSDHRIVCYAFIKHAFKGGWLSADAVKDLVAKAFKYEDCNSGLREFLPVVKLIDSKDGKVLFEGFVMMEKNHERTFGWRDDSVKKFIVGLSQEKRVEYLSRTLLVSSDDKFIWFAGQQLIALDIDAAARVFVQIAGSKKESQAKVATLAQLAVRVSEERRGQMHWSVRQLNEGSASRFAPVFQALFDYAQSEACPIARRFHIATQPLMFVTDSIFCKAAIPLLRKTILEEKDFSEQARGALVALLNYCAQKNKFFKEVEDVLTDIYASRKRKGMLDGLLWILSNDIRGDICKPLYSFAVEFLKKIQAVDAVPVLQKALDSRRPDGDLGMFARETYVSALKKFALEGSHHAVMVISNYRKKGILFETIPMALADIYQGATNDLIKNTAVQGVAERFILSIKDASNNEGLFYLHELKAVERLKESPFIQDAFLKGIETMGSPEILLSSGMCAIVKEAASILPKSKNVAAQEKMKALIADLAKQRDELASNHMRAKSYISTIDAITAEAAMQLM